MQRQIVGAVLTWIFVGVWMTSGGDVPYSWYAAGNRLFFRTAGHRWCFGDPKQPFQAPSKMPVEAMAGK